MSSFHESRKFFDDLLNSEVLAVLLNRKGLNVMDDKTSSKSYPAGSNKEKVGVLERFSYANLDFAGQLIATVVNSYLMYFFYRRGSTFRGSNGNYFTRCSSR